MSIEATSGPTSELYVAVDLGGTRFRVANVLGEGRIVYRVAEATRVEDGRDTVLRRIIEAIRMAIVHSGGRRVVAIGIAAPGPLNPKTGVIYNPPNMPGWDQVPMKEIIEKEMRLPVFVGNDANLAALGEHQFGAGQGLTDLVYITVSTGIGGGIIADNHLLLGATGLAGEIGHMTIVADGPRCGCGNKGCLEALSSGTAIARRGRELASEGAQTTLLEMAGGDPAMISAQLVEGAARQGDPLAVRVMREAAEYLGIGVANVVSLLNPQMVIIGGGVSNAGALLFQPVWDVVAHRTMLAHRVNLQIVPPSLGDNAGLLGCAALAMAG